MAVTVTVKVVTQAAKKVTMVSTAWR